MPIAVSPKGQDMSLPLGPGGTRSWGVPKSVGDVPPRAAASTVLPLCPESDVQSSRCDRVVSALFRPRFPPTRVQPFGVFVQVHLLEYLNPAVAGFSGGHQQALGARRR